MEADVLFSFVGNHDPLRIPGPGDDPGPVLSLIRHRPFAQVVLFITRGEYAERAGVIRDAARDEGLAATGREGTPDLAGTPPHPAVRRPGPGPKFSFVDIELQSVVDYEEIYRKLADSLARVLPTLPWSTTRNFVLLDPGTPQMQTVWFLMVQSGGFAATLLQGIPPRFGGGRYRSREVRLDPSRFPVEIRLRSQVEPSGLAVAETPETRGDEWTILRSEITGRSEPMVRLLERANRAARYDGVVCITGETGTGKELLARHIHDRSPRSGRPFIPVNSAGLAEGLVASALFGHRKGAFTGADANRPGAFRSADGGTLFLDEVGELPPPVQATLLRAIDRGEITPVGRDTPEHVDVRIITATNRDLSAMVAAGTFRADLYERLQQLPIHLPPLRERPGDVELLAETFLAQWNDEHHTAIAFAPEAFEEIRRYRWPRNVRQLQNVVRRLCVYADGPVIDGAGVAAVIAEAEGVGLDAGVGGGDAGTDGAVSGRNAGVGAGKAPSGPDAGVGAGEAPSGPDAVPRSRAASSAGAGAGAFPVDLLGILQETERAWYAEALARSGGNKADAARLLGLNPPAFRKALRERYPDLL
jgi:transcriptional regulator with GAF, ATPase, and Fis domain